MNRGHPTRSLLLVMLGLPILGGVMGSVGPRNARVAAAAASGSVMICGYGRDQDHDAALAAAKAAFSSEYYLMYPTLNARCGMSGGVLTPVGTYQTNCQEVYGVWQCTYCHEFACTPAPTPTVPGPATPGPTAKPSPATR